MMARIKLYLFLLLTAALLNGCLIYRLDVPQGNEVTQDQVDKLRIGLTKSQVQYLLGSSLLQDPFHANQWDYIYVDKIKGKTKTDKRLTVFFEGDQLVRWEGEVLPLAGRARLRAESDASATRLSSQEKPSTLLGE